MENEPIIDDFHIQHGNFHSYVCQRVYAYIHMRVQDGAPQL